MPYTIQLSVIWTSLAGLLHGVQVTLFLTIVSMFFALILGIFIALAKISPQRLLNVPADAFVEFIRNTPLLVQLVWLYYCMPIIFGINLPATTTAVVGLSIAEAAIIAEIVRAGIQGLPRGQIEAADAVGFTRWVTMRRIVLPQALQLMTPPLLNSFVSLLKSTALVAIIAVPDLMFVAQRIASETFRPIEILTSAAIMYFVITYPFVLFVRYIERRNRRVRNGRTA